MSTFFFISPQTKDRFVIKRFRNIFIFHYLLYHRKKYVDVFYPVLKFFKKDFLLYSLRAKEDAFYGYFKNIIFIPIKVLKGCFIKNIFFYT